MAELEIGSNMVIVISLIVNAVVIPLLAVKHKECNHLKKKHG